MVNQMVFFQSFRSLKQGDPLSPTLFTIAAEVLERGLNSLHEDEIFKGYGMPKWIEKKPTSLKEPTYKRIIKHISRVVLDPPNSISYQAWYPSQPKDVLYK